ncbi:MAG: UxaA family hydrolase [Candidatus Latescibacterota bacterium]
MSVVLPLAEVARLPVPGDNVAIAVRRLDPGTRIQHEGRALVLDHTVMEGHRFAALPIPAGALLLSWGLPFGRALCDIAAGGYVCNEGTLEALRGRALDFALPAAPNFADQAERPSLEALAVRRGRQVEPCPHPATFVGYDRGSRGAGTRSFVVILGTTSRTGSAARLLAARLQAAAAACPGIDGVVAVDHTEGGGERIPNNRDLLLRCLAGLVVHPNVAAFLALDYGTEAVTNRMLREYMQQHGYPLERMPHRFGTLGRSLEAELAEGEAAVHGWLGQLAGQRRVEVPLAQLRVALQCGGSDAFSGISGNPLAGWVACEVIRHGGSANLAETDELIGAEAYVLQNVRDADTARRFLDLVRRFEERVAWHGESAEGNPSGGNKYRGLYNIALKSIGAARKRDPRVRLDYCLEYAEPMKAPGYYFMDSPGNDLESIAGQVASGCNLIFFVTGNGSVTNFPFVPTIKIVTTTARYRLLAGEMDVNAGAYQDGTSMEELGRSTFDLALRVASGQRSRGEEAGHAQVQIWRDWPQQDGARLQELRRRPIPTGRPLAVRHAHAPQQQWSGLRAEGQLAGDRVGLVLPTSLCSAQVARLAAERLQALGVGRQQGISRYAALVHTEGCGSTADEIHARVTLGYLLHPLVGRAVILEHGCEKTHNDYMRARLAAAGIAAERFGWASVQMDGGIASALERIEAWFREQAAGMVPPEEEAAGLGALRLGILASGPMESQAGMALGRLAAWTASAGGTVVVPDTGTLLGSDSFTGPLLAGPDAAASLAYGQVAREPGLHVMEAPTRHWTETLTGLGATGVEVVLAHVGEHPGPGHPLIPVVQVSAARGAIAAFGDDLDGQLDGDPEGWAHGLLDLVLEVASRRRVARAVARRHADFQLTRGLLGVSM